MCSVLRRFRQNASGWQDPPPERPDHEPGARVRREVIPGVRRQAREALVLMSAAAREAPRLIAVVVLPTPPFWFVIAITRAVICSTWNIHHLLG